MKHLNPDFNVDSFSFNFTCNGFVIPKEFKAFFDCFTFQEYSERKNGSIIVPAQNAKYSADFHPSELEFEIPFLEVSNINIDGKFYATEKLLLKSCLITDRSLLISQPYIDAHAILKQDMVRVWSIFGNMVDTMIEIYFDPDNKETACKIEASVERIKRAGAISPRAEHSLHDAPLCDDFEDLERDYD